MKQFGFEEANDGQLKCTRTLLDGTQCKITIKKCHAQITKMRKHDLVHQNKASYKNLRKVSTNQCSKICEL